MKPTLLAAVAAAAILLTGCGPMVSLHPLYTKAELVSDLPLEGNWTDEEGGVYMVRRQDDGYRVTYTEKDGGEPKRVEVHLVRLADLRFADIEPVDVPDLALPVHLLAKVWMEGGELRATAMDTDWLRERAAARLPHLATGKDDWFLIGAPTEVLQKFVVEHAADPRAFAKDIARFRRAAP